MAASLRREAGGRRKREAENDEDKKTIQFWLILQKREGVLRRAPLSLSLATLHSPPLRVTLKTALPPRHHPPHVRLEPPRRQSPRAGLGLDDAPYGRAGEDAVGAPRREHVVGLADAVDVAEGAVDLSKWWSFGLVDIGGARESRGGRG